MTSRLLCFAVSCLLLVLTVTCQSAARFTVVDMQAGYATAYGVNSAGVVSGSADPHAFRWDNGSKTDLGTLGGTYSHGIGINDAGDVAGWSQDSTGIGHAVVWHGTSIVDIGAGYSYDVNNSGTVVGWLASSCAFSWTGGTTTLLPSLSSGYDCANAINSAGKIVGYSTASSGYSHAVLWQDGAVQDLGTLGGQWSEASDINEAGQVVGAFRTADGRATHAFSWQGGAMQDLGTLGGTWAWAYGVNDRGQIVGASSLANGENHAFIWENGVMTDLNLLVGSIAGDKITYAEAINNSGVIVGQRGYCAGVVLAPVPEPGSMLALMCGLGGLILRKTRR